jgi:asparagine synthase (glutamine-hydrolysing)
VVKFAGYFDGEKLHATEGELESFDNIQMLGDLLLFKRDALTDKLGIMHADQYSYTDAHLVVLAFQKWGTEFFRHLQGVWTFVLFDAKERKIYLSRNISENSSLFYCSKNAVLYFSSSTTYIQQILGDDLEIDSCEFAALSLRLIGNTPGETILKNIHHVLPGSYIAVDAHMNQIKSTILTEPRQAIRFKYEKDYFLAFKSLLADAVIQRMGHVKKAGLFLSSGLDSTTVLYFISNAAKANQQIITYTSVPSFRDERDCSETISEEPMVRQLLADFTGVNSKFLPFHEISFVSMFHEQHKRSLFYPIVHSNSFWIEGILKQARRDGVDGMFTGQMGNYSISFRGKKKIKLFAVDRVIFFLKQSQLGKYFFKQNNWQFSVLHDHILKDCVTRKGMNDIFEQGGNHYHDIASFRKLAFERLHVFASTHWSILSQEHGIRVFDPTADHALKSFLDRIPSDLFSKNGIEKYLLKKSMEGLLPSFILKNRYPKPQTADLGRRLAKENFLTEKVEILMERFRDSPFFDMKKLVSVHSELVRSKSRGRQHVLGFHLLYMISLMDAYDRISRRKKGAQPIAVG